LSVRWVDPVTGASRSPWSTATPGGLPAPDTQRTLDTGAHDCESEDFPRWGPGGVLTCSRPTTPGDRLRVDRFAPEQPGAPLQTIQLSSGVTHTSHSSAPQPSQAWVSSGLDGSLIWASEVLALWSPNSSGSVPITRLGSRGRPTDDGRWTAFGRPDRVEVTRRGSSQRSQLDLRPSDYSANLALSEPWLAAITGPPGHSQLQLQHLNLQARRPVTTPGDVVHPLLSGEWLSWCEDGAIHTLPLGGGPGAVLPLSAGFGSPAISLDDFRIDEVRDSHGIELWATHLPTATPLPLWSGPGHHRLRGGGGGRLLVWSRSPSGMDTLQLRSTPIRVFEEDGAHWRGDAMDIVDGGHGGRGGRLQEGEARTLRLDPGPERVRVELFVTPSAGSAQVELRQGSTLRRVTGVSGAPAEDLNGTNQTAPVGRWVGFPGTISPSAGADPADRQLELAVTAEAGGFVLDAVRVIEVGS
ncbi:MAG TPA: hypothetical protein DIU15_07185, partial [Deltaproteobacteria bacterium]|nr:hypothetical protein [Deltaproteobacteria bacterium]